MVSSVLSEGSKMVIFICICWCCVVAASDQCHHAPPAHCSGLPCGRNGGNRLQCYIRHSRHEGAPALTLIIRQLSTMCDCVS